MEQSPAILIRLTKLTDTSLIVHWLTEEAGVVKTVARGAKRPGGPFTGKLDLFFGGEIAWEPAKRGELHLLKEIAISAWRTGLRKSYAATLLAGYCCRLIEQGVEPGHPEPELFDLLRRALDHIDEKGASERAMRHFERELARLFGVSNDQRAPDAALRDAIGDLPSIRRDLIERLAGFGDFGSSGAPSGVNDV
ncbi:DNA repair protein RecO [Luteolibacter sp. LG18]|uniref:DNA repair protein RecO n=1 Tax=Luteolibacter sp. LG18 TaxID=2819286 RepID=UPI002B32162F|nr:DNA repair protein RecO [Luteolibacter sp. LG18]